jgi:hypothetical protein
LRDLKCEKVVVVSHHGLLRRIVKAPHAANRMISVRSLPSIYSSVVGTDTFLHLILNLCRLLHLVLATPPTFDYIALVLVACSATYQPIQWENAALREYAFADPSGQDDEADLVRVEPSIL